MPLPTRRPQILAALALTALTALAGCAQAPAAPPPAPLALYVSPTAGGLADNPELVAKLAGGVHDYYRFINVPFSEAVCRSFADVVAEIPPVTLHGDAHLEQFAVTDAGHGLTDFDDISEGPAVIDLVRFGVSLRLASERRGWDDAPARARFLAGYRDALDDPDRHPPEPGLVSRLEALFDVEREPFLAWADGLMQPLDDDTASRLHAAFEGYAREQLAGDHQLPAGFFEVKQVGAVGLGVGSALDEKYLLRIEGNTPARDDDVVIEAKEVRDLARIPCIQPGRKADPFRVLVGAARVPYHAYLGFFEMHGKRFWLHAWIGNYQELELDELESPEELAAVAYEAGLQLARAHFADTPASEQTARRREQQQVLDRLTPRIQAAIDQLGAETHLAWDRFRREAASDAPAAVAP